MNLDSKEELVGDIVCYQMVHMPLREILDTFSDDHYGDLPLANVLNRARINMTRYYRALSLVTLEDLWSDIRGVNASERP